MEDKNSKVDAAIAKADELRRKQRARVREAEGEENKPARQKLSDEEKAARKAEADRVREQKKAERAAIREQKKAEREAAQAHRRREREAQKALKAAARAQEREHRKPAHMSKVEKAAAKLPELTPELDETLANLVEKFGVPEISRLVAHLQHSNRVKSTLESANVEFEVGQQVRILASESDPSVIGKVGTVTEMRKIRVILDVEDMSRPVYLFASDCEPLQQIDTHTPQEESETEEGEEVEGVDVNEESFLSIEDESTGTEG